MSTSRVLHYYIPIVFLAARPCFWNRHELNSNEKETPPEISIKKKAAVKNFAIFTGKHLFWSLFLIK